MDRLRYEIWGVGGIREMQQARDSLMLAWQLATLWAEGLWDDKLIEVPLRTLELSQGGVVVFVQNVHRLTPGTEMYAEVGSRSADVVVKFYKKMEEHGALRVKLPLNAYYPGFRKEAIITTLDIDREILEWMVPLAKRRGIGVGWERVMDPSSQPKRYSFTDTPLSEW